MKKHFIIPCFFMLMACFMTPMGFVTPTSAASVTYTLKNRTLYPINAALAIPTRHGWVIKGWYRVEAASDKRLTFYDAIPGKGFAYHARSLNGPNRSWGKNVRLCVGSQAMTHRASTCPQTGKVYYRSFNVRNGHSITFNP